NWTEAMNVTKYSPAFREEVVRKVLMRGERTIGQMAAELNVPYHSVRNWLRKPQVGCCSSTRLWRETCSGMEHARTFSSPAGDPRALARGAERLVPRTGAVCASAAALAGRVLPGAPARAAGRRGAQAQGRTGQPATGTQSQGAGAVRGGCLAGAAKKVPGAVGGRGQMTSL